MKSTLVEKRQDSSRAANSNVAQASSKISEHSNSLNNNRIQNGHQTQLKEVMNSENAPTQLKQYSVIRDINMSLAKKTWKTKGQEGDKDYQTAKVRARGAMYGDLREEYGVKELDGVITEIDDVSTTDEYLRKKALITEKYDLIEDDVAEAETSRPALKTDVKMGKRAKNSQAGPINKMVDGVKYIGAHLVKREWGGADNMWNVVAWPQAAENEWAATFELPVDRKGIRGEDPGNIKIEVIKEDEELTLPKSREIIDEEVTLLIGDENDQAKERLNNSSAMRNLTENRWSSNRALESVPVIAKGTNFEGSITLNKSKTKWNEAKAGALDTYRKNVKAELLSTEEIEIHEMNPDKLKGNWDDEEARSDLNRKKERAKDWGEEKRLYSPGFVHEDNVVDS